MVTAAIPGFGAFVDVSIDGGTTFKRIGELRDVTLTLEMSPIDASSHDDAPDTEFIGGRRNWTASAEMLYIAADAAQDDVFSALNGNTLTKFNFFPKIGSGLEQFDGDGFFTSWELAGPNDDAAAVAIEIQGSGGLVKVAQA